MKWNKHYPNPYILKKEIKYMIDSFVEVLLETIPKKDISGIYFKGSALKEWESPLDYVPEISDVDIHLLFVDESSVEKYLGTTEQAINIQSNVERIYFSKITNPGHVPRPQLLVLNTILNDENFVSSPKNTISVLYGKEYPEVDPDKLKRVRQIDCQHLIEEDQFLKKFAFHVIDRPSKYLWQALRNLVWHISPIGSRVLSLKGINYEKAWSMNRTQIVKYLKKLGEKRLAQNYSQFYLNAWDYFLSNYSNTDAGRSAIISGVNTLNRGVQIAKSYLISLRNI
jgi:hypothetical protein